MAVAQTSYADWLNQNEANMMQAGGYQQPPAATAPSPVVAASGAAAPAVATPAETPANEPAKGQDQWQQMASMISSQRSSAPSPVTLKPSAFNNQVQSDAPSVAKAPGDPGYIGTIAKIVGAVMSYGGTAAMEGAQKTASNQGG